MRPHRNNHVIVFVTDHDIRETIHKIVEPYFHNNIKIEVMGDHKLNEIITKIATDYHYQNISINPASSSYGTNNKVDYNKINLLIDQVTKNYVDVPLTVIGKLDSLDDFHENFDDIVKYEQSINNKIDNNLLTAFCIYQVENLNQTEIQKLMAVHPYSMISGTIIDNNSLNGISPITSEFITICMHCLRIRNNGKWEYYPGTLLPLDGQMFSHGVCDICMKQYDID